MTWVDPRHAALFGVLFPGQKIYPPFFPPNPPEDQTSAGAAWTAFEPFRIKHPVSGKEVTVPGRNGPNALLVSGWKTTPAGRQLASGDMILSGQVSPDGKLFAFTNTGYTHHALHIVDLATEKEIATFPMEQAWSGLAFSPDGNRIYVSSGAGYKASDIQIFDRWDNDGWKEARVGYTLYGPLKDQTAVAWLGTSPDGALLYALNNSDQQLYILDTHGGRARRSGEGRRPSDVGPAVEGRQDAVCRQPRRSANVAIVDVSDPERVRTSPGRSRPIRIPTTSR